MRDLGFREWTALAALVFGVFLGFVYLDPASGDSSQRPPLEQGKPPPTATPAVPTAEPPSQLPRPTSWDVRFASIANGREVVDAGSIVPTLDLAFERAPFPDYRDDSWKVTATTSVEMGKGSSLFVVHYDAAVRVFINDSEVATRDEPQAPDDLVIAFPHDSGRFTIRIEATDRSGPFTLRYVE